MLFYVLDRQKIAPNNAVLVVNKDISKDSLATNRTSLIIPSKENDKVNGSTVIKKIEHFDWINKVSRNTILLGP